MALAVFAGAGSASAATITFDLDVEFSNGTPPAGSTPWASATFDDSFGGPNTVRLTMSTANLVGSENVDLWAFNFNPALDPTLLTFAVVNNADSSPTTSTGVNFFQADGDGKFDILFDFPPPPGTEAGLFTSGETVVYDITYTSAISVADFAFASVQGGGQGTFGSAAHVQRIGDEADGSGWIGESSFPIVPEPSTALLLGAGLAALAARRRRS